MASTAQPSRAARIRLDRLMVERGLARSRAKAQAMILAGQVLVDSRKIEKCGAAVGAAAGLRVLGNPVRYVSRAGPKLEAALDYFRVDPAGKACIDVGASTGGFTDCLLQRGAARVFAVDSGTRQLHGKLRQDERVVVLENVNARSLRFEQIGTRVELVTMDVSFISSTLILPALLEFLAPGAELLVLVKPQFEVGREQVGRRGVVKDTKLHRLAINKVSQKMADLGFRVQSWVESAFPGAEGNREFFVHAAWPGKQ